MGHNPCQRISPSFQIRPLIVAAAVALAGCSDSTMQDHAACKLKAMEQYKTNLSSKEHDDELAYYVKICMEAAGYKEREHCGKATARWILDECFFRDTWGQ